MQVSATSFPSTTRITANTVEPAPIKPVEQGKLDPIVDRVTLSKTREQPASYDVAPVYVSGLRDNKAKGIVATSLDRNLVTSLNSVAAGKAPFTVGNFFSQIGALSGETLEYRNDSRRWQVTQEQAVKNVSPNFNVQPTSEKAGARLSVRTKEGDTIQIELKYKSVGTSNTAMEFSFVVDGSLSPAEQKALGELATKLGEMGDEFFRTDTTELRNLKGIDTSVISHFNFSLQRPSGEGSMVEHTYDFSVDEQAQTQTLRATDVRGYSIDITTQLQGLVEGKVADAAMLQPYIDLIRQATDDADVENKSHRFITDAFESMFAQFIDAPAAEADSAAALAAFDTGLPDFTASIKSEVKHNRNFYSQASALSLSMQQQTQIEEVGDSLLIKQESRYELVNNRFEPLVGLERADLENGNYRYVTEHIEGITNRILSMTGDRVNNLLVDKTVERDKETSEFRNHKLVDQQTDDFADRLLQQFTDELARLNANKQYAAINELLNLSKADLFLQRS